MKAKYIVGLSALTLILALSACTPAPDATVEVVDEPVIVEEDMVIEPGLDEELELVIEDEMMVDDPTLEEVEE